MREFIIDKVTQCGHGKRMSAVLEIIASVLATALVTVLIIAAVHAFITNE